MARKDGPLYQRMKRLPLWQWGAFCVFGGLFANVATMLMIQARDMRRSEERAAQLGGACAAVLLVIVGIALIALHSLRRSRNK